MVTGNHLTWCPFVVLDLVQALEVDEVVVEVMDACCWVSLKGSDQQLSHQGQTSVLTVDVGRYGVELVDHVRGVPIISDDGVGTTHDRFFTGSNVVGEGDVGLVH